MKWLEALVLTAICALASCGTVGTKTSDDAAAIPIDAGTEADVDAPTGAGGATGTDADADADADADQRGCNSTPEICNGLDDDCDGVVDNGCPIDQAIIGTSLNATLGPLFGSLTQGSAVRFSAPCPDGQQIIGLTGNDGAAIDALGVKCGILRVREDRSTIPYGYSVTIEAGDSFAQQGGAGGVAQGIDGTLGCRVNEVVTLIEAWSPDVTGTCPSNYCATGGSKATCTTIEGLAVACASYAIAGRPGSFSLGLTSARASALAGSGDGTGRKSGMFVCPAPGSVHRLDGAKGPFLSDCASTVVQGIQATCTIPTLPIR
jgi:hypothetical protein